MERDIDKICYAFLVIIDLDSTVEKNSVHHIKIIHKALMI